MRVPRSLGGTLAVLLLFTGSIGGASRPAAAAAVGAGTSGRVGGGPTSPPAHHAPAPHLGTGAAIVLTIGSPQALVGGQAEQLPAAPFIRGGRTFLPVAAIAQLLGLRVRWDGSTHQVFLTGSGRSIELQVGRRSYRVNGRLRHGPVAPFIQPPGVAMAPVGVVAGALGLQVGWNGRTRQVTLRARPRSGGPAGSAAGLGVVRGGQIFVALDVIPKAFGVQAVWHAASRRIDLTLGATQVVAAVGSQRYTADGRARTAAAAPFRTAQGRVMVPLDLIRQAFGFQVLLSGVAGSAGAAAAAIRPESYSCGGGGNVGGCGGGSGGSGSGSGGSGGSGSGSGGSGGSGSGSGGPGSGGGGGSGSVPTCPLVNQAQEFLYAADGLDGTIGEYEVMDPYTFGVSSPCAVPGSPALDVSSTSAPVQITSGLGSWIAGSTLLAFNAGASGSHGGDCVQEFAVSPLTNTDSGSILGALTQADPCQSLAGAPLSVANEPWTGGTPQSILLTCLSDQGTYPSGDEYVLEQEPDGPQVIQAIQVCATPYADPLAFATNTVTVRSAAAATQLVAVPQPAAGESSCAYAAAGDQILRFAMQPYGLPQQVGATTILAKGGASGNVSALVVAPDGHALYASDSVNDRVVQYAIDWQTCGLSVSGWISTGDAPTQLAELNWEPPTRATDVVGLVFALNSGNVADNTISVFTIHANDGLSPLNVGAIDAGPGPVSIATDDESLLFVATPAPAIRMYQSSCAGDACGTINLPQVGYIAGQWATAMAIDVTGGG